MSAPIPLLSSDPDAVRKDLERLLGLPSSLLVNDDRVQFGFCFEEVDQDGRRRSAEYWFQFIWRNGGLVYYDGLRLVLQTSIELSAGAQADFRRRQADLRASEKHTRRIYQLAGEWLRTNRRRSRI